MADRKSAGACDGSIRLVPKTSPWMGPDDPALAYFALRREGEPSFLLESAERPGESARYSIVGTNPLLHVKVRGKELMIHGQNEIVKLAKRRASFETDPMKSIGKALMLSEMDACGSPSRYALGAFGYVSYDYALSHPDVRVKEPPVPEIEFMVPGSVVLFDHLTGAHTHVSVLPLIEGEEIIERVPTAERLLPHLKEDGSPAAKTSAKAISDVSRKRFEEMVSAAKEYIRKGDVIQTVLSRKIEVNPPPPLESFYLRLKSINPSPYMFLLEFPGRTMVGSSPEVLVRVEGRKAITRPIAGTRRIGGGERKNHLERELLKDEKERAEHVMLVDLGRNDLGRVCSFGSVRVREFMKLERYSHVVHLVSTVVGELRNGVTCLDALAAAFPAGTVTGAPKVRAMEIIDELEVSRRGVYAGAVGCISYTGDMDMAITIRTMVVEEETASVQVGAGVVADSVPWKEYYETENKARALLEAAGCA